jgi:hypothetical protein
MRAKSQNYPDAHALQRGGLTLSKGPNRFSGFHDVRRVAETWETAEAGFFSGRLIRQRAARYLKRKSNLKL